MADYDTSRHWLELYREAHKAIQSRIRELWYAGSPVTPERRQLDTASNLLGILRMIGKEK